MGIFSSFKWFKSQKETELEELRVEEQKKKNQLLDKELEYDWKPPVVLNSDKPYKKVKLVDSILTIVLQDGSVISKPGATEKEFIKARLCTTEAELMAMTTSLEAVKEQKEYEKKVEKAQAIINGVDILKNNPEFVVIDNSVYLKGINRSIPALLVEKFAELSGASAYTDFDAERNTEEYQALKKFWLKCCLNPNAQSAEDLYTFLTHHQFKIDRHGNFYAYRRVVSVGEENKALVDFVSNAYNKVKAIWKKKPADFQVYENDGELSLTKTWNDEGKFIGNLQDLYLDLPNMKENRYTDAHTRTMDYKVGEVSSIPRNEGNDNNSISCSKGLHIASKEYNYSGFGDTPVLAIISPTDVLAVPLGEVGKLRTCRWFFATTLSEDEQYILDEDDFDVSDLGDVFEEKCMENLAEYVQNSFAEEVKRHTFTLPSITGVEIQKIVTSLEEMKDALNGRINYI